MERYIQCDSELRHFSGSSVSSRGSLSLDREKSYNYNKIQRVKVDTQNAIDKIPRIPLVFTFASYSMTSFCSFVIVIDTNGTAFVMFNGEAELN
jgi:retron-type reverse transcriptase